MAITGELNICRSYKYQHCIEAKLQVPVQSFQQVVDIIEEEYRSDDRIATRRVLIALLR